MLAQHYFLEGAKIMNRIRCGAMTLTVCVACLVTLSNGCKTCNEAKSGQQLQAGRWKVLADVPVPRFGGAGSVVNGKLHLFGGVNMNPHTPAGALEARAVKLHHIYDPATNSWSEGAPMPDAKGWPAIAVYEGMIYLFGGDNKAIDVSMTDTAWVYDPATDKYSEIAPLPHPRSYCYAVTVGDYIYIFGARTLRSDGLADRSTFRYDPRTNTYKRMADLPEGARFIVHGSYKGYIYAVHGETDFETYANGALKYDVAADKWTKLNFPRIEQRKWYLSQHSTHAAIGSKLFVLGGMSKVTNKRSNRAEFFDMETETFGEAEPMPSGRCCAVAGVIDNKIYVAGGFWDVTEDVCECKETWGYPFPKDSKRRK
jgi:N-acetylneuraminic acid mutarotase